MLQIESDVCLPDTLHEGGIQSFVVILKVNPATQPLDSDLPLLGIPVKAMSRAVTPAHVKSQKQQSHMVLEVFVKSTTC